MPKSAFSDSYTNFRLALCAERKQAGLTQAALAALLNKPQSFVSKYEIGERRLDVVEFFHIAKAIGFDANRFLRKLGYLKR
jgi:transcriptional regulator with XRE-family HTH domain